MGLPAYNLEPEREELFRQMVHEEVDKWVDELLSIFGKASQPTLMELSERFTNTRKEFLGACFQKLIEQKYSFLLEQEYCPCPRCRKSCKRRRISAKELATMQGESHLRKVWNGLKAPSVACFLPKSAMLSAVFAECNQKITKRRRKSGNSSVISQTTAIGSTIMEIEKVDILLEAEGSNRPTNLFAIHE